MTGNKILYWLVVVIAALTLALSALNATIMVKNRDMQTDMDKRRAFIDASIPLAQLNQAIVLALREVAEKKNDAAVRSLLQQQGYAVGDANAASVTTNVPVKKVSKTAPKEKK